MKARCSLTGDIRCDNERSIKNEIKRSMTTKLHKMTNKYNIIYLIDTDILLPNICKIFSLEFIIKDYLKIFESN